MELAELRDLVYQQIERPADGSGTHISETYLDKLINQAQKIVCAKTHCLRTRWTRNGTADTAKYALPINCITVKAVEYNDKILGKKSWEEMRAYGWKSTTLKTAADPKYWGIWSRSVFLLPAPNANLTNGLRMWGPKYADDLSADDDVSEIPYEWHHLMWYYALWHTLVALQKSQEASYYRNNFLEGVDEMETYYVDDSDIDHIVDDRTVLTDETIVT